MDVLLTGESRFVAVWNFIGRAVYHGQNIEDHQQLRAAIHQAWNEITSE
jgi:hypothetical protein